MIFFKFFVSTLKMLILRIGVKIFVILWFIRSSCRSRQDLKKCLFLNILSRFWLNHWLIMLSCRRFILPSKNLAWLSWQKLFMKSVSMNAKKFVFWRSNTLLYLFVGFRKTLFCRDKKVTESVAVALTFYER